MKKLVLEISTYTKERDTSFQIVVNNGVELLTQNGYSSGKLDRFYINAFDGFLIESLYYGYPYENRASDNTNREYILPYLKKIKENGTPILVIDYCSEEEKQKNSFVSNSRHGFLPFPAPQRALNTVPNYPPWKENSRDIHALSDASNFLYLINPEFDSIESYTKTITSNNYDLVFVDGFFDGRLLHKETLNQFKKKSCGAKRLVFGYVSVGEASDFRYYWRSQWNIITPKWIERENPNWPGSYKVRYWREEWKKILYKGVHSYIDKLYKAGFDGIILDVVDAYLYFEGIQ